MHLTVCVCPWLDESFLVRLELNVANPFWEKSTWKERRKKKKKERKNNAKFSGHYFHPRTHTVHAQLLRSHQFPDDW